MTFSDANAAPAIQRLPFVCRRCFFIKNFSLSSRARAPLVSIKGKRRRKTKIGLIFPQHRSGGERETLISFPLAPAMVIHFDAKAD